MWKILETVWNKGIQNRRIKKHRNRIEWIVKNYRISKDRNGYFELFGTKEKSIGTWVNISREGEQKISLKLEWMFYFSYVLHYYGFVSSGKKLSIPFLWNLFLQNSFENPLTQTGQHNWVYSTLFSALEVHYTAAQWFFPPLWSGIGINQLHYRHS